MPLQFHDSEGTQESYFCLTNINKIHLKSLKLRMWFCHFQWGLYYRMKCFFYQYIQIWPYMLILIITYLILKIQVQDENRSDPTKPVVHENLVFKINNIFINGLVQDLNLSKQWCELLTSIFKGWNLLQTNVRICSSHNGNSDSETTSQKKNV